MPAEPKGTLLQSLFDVRRVDARVLLKAKRYTGALYLGGYALECLLKAAICQQLNRSHYPVRQARYRTHDLIALKTLCSVVLPIDDDPDAARHFRTINSVWTVSIRYEGPSLRVTSVRRFLDALDDLGQWIKEQMSRE